MYLRHSQRSICGALLVAFALEPQAARAGGDLLQGGDGKGKEGIGRSTSLLEMVMPANERPPPGSASTRRAPETANPARPAARAPAATSQTEASPDVDAPRSGDVRIPIRLDSRALLDTNDLFLDARRGVIERKEPLVGKNPPGTDRL